MMNPLLNWNVNVQHFFVILDDDYVLSDEDFFISDEEEASPFGRKKNDSDSDFVPEDDGDDDWGAKPKKPARGGRVFTTLI